MKIINVFQLKTRLRDVYFSKKVFSVFPPPNEVHTILEIFLKFNFAFFYNDFLQTVLKSLGSEFLGLCEYAKLILE